MKGMLAEESDQGNDPDSVKALWELSEMFVRDRQVKTVFWFGTRWRPRKRPRNRPAITLKLVPTCLETYGEFQCQHGRK